MPKDKLTEAMVMGTPVVALCGKVWVPSRDPERFPVCPECREIWEGMAPATTTRTDLRSGSVERLINSCSGRAAGPERCSCVGSTAQLTWPLLGSASETKFQIISAPEHCTTTSADQLA